MKTNLQLNSEEYRLINDLVYEITRSLKYDDVLKEWVVGDIIYSIDDKTKKTLENLKNRL